ncbi:putative disease resistance protein [Camellia lanceoleosa]|uniref:Disease resistance protein n=1 Tax=Camellia lanceoleosa TaxID=1840588 RepID=A0ACC0I9R8_9ERIC|nr:putative disease resistance protein [Camellia lanceoleosa]
MMAFLRVADSMEENNPELKVWVKQVRDAAYDTEDVLDKFKLNFAHNHGTGFRGFVRKISFSIKTLKALYQIAYEVQRIKSRVINISMGHQRYHDMVYWSNAQGPLVLTMHGTVVMEMCFYMKKLSLWASRSPKQN